MLSLKRILINISMIFALLFGLISSATASESIFEETKARAEKGSSFNQAYLGQQYLDGQDYSKAAEWYEKSANQGNSDGQFGLGYLYSSGLGVRQDYSKALEWFKKAAKQNHKGAQGSIGILYESGLGIRQNKTIAKEWYGKACDNGSQQSCDLYRRLNEQGY